jgi:SAM-dependent methyltransferase
VENVVNDEDASEFGPDNGWVSSAPGWVSAIGDQGDTARVIILDPVMLSLVGDVSGKRVLDLGCGEGRFSRLLAARGADAVGLDPVREMVGAAQGRDRQAGGHVQGVGERLPFRASAFDLVVSYLSLIDITDFGPAIREAARVLRPGGFFLVANLSAFATSSDGWVRDASGTRLYKRVDQYLSERAVTLEGQGMRFRNWHRPLEAYMDAFLGAGLILRRFHEPTPDETLRGDQRFEGDFRLPDFVVMLWQVPA